MLAIFYVPLAFNFCISMRNAMDGGGREHTDSEALVLPADKNGRNDISDDEKQKKDIV